MRARRVRRHGAHVATRRDARHRAARAALETIFGAVTRDGLITAVLGTEPGTLALFHALTRGEEVDGGYAITGTKIFDTLSSVAGLFVVGIRFDEAGSDSLGYAFVPRGMRGMTINDDWGRARHARDGL